MATNIEDVFRLNDEHEIYEFFKAYAMSNSALAELLVKRFLPQKEGESKSKPIDIDREIAQCFDHTDRQHGYKKWESNLDWYAISNDLYRLIEKGKYMLRNGLVHEAIDLALGILRNVGEKYELDAVYEDYNFDGDDFCTNDAVNLLKEAMASEGVTRQEKLDIAEELEKISKLEAYEGYCLCDLDNLIEDIKHSLLSEKDYVEYLKAEMEQAKDYDKSIYAIKLFDFHLERNHEEEAEKWAKANLEHASMINRYVEWLIDGDRPDDALKTLNKGIKINTERHGCISNWEKIKLEIYESKHDTTNIIEQCRKLFIMEYDSIPYYHKLKKLISPTEWSTFLAELLTHKDFGTDACSDLSQIYYEEKLYTELFQTLNKANRELLRALEKYAKCLTKEQQTILIGKVEKVLVSFADHEMGRKNYQELANRLDMLKRCCAVGKASCENLVSQFRINYRRPAMLDELKDI